ncbi:MAG: response regulator [Polyangiaceae bacterium]
MRSPLSLRKASSITPAERQNLVGRLLAFARERPRESAPVDVHHLVEEISERPEPTSTVTLSAQLDAPDAFVRGDAQALRDSLVNLATNARESMPAGGAVRLHTENVELHRSSQNGRCFHSPGTLPTYRGHGYGRRDLRRRIFLDIFEPFSPRSAEGAFPGLGLSVVYATVRDHGGTLEVESAPDREPESDVLAPTERYSTLESRPSHQLVEGRGRLLLADDEPTLRRAEAALLRKLGYDVCLAEDGERAVEIYRTDPLGFDLVLLDIMMPKLNGRETLKALRRINPRVKALYISAFGLSSDDPSAEDGVQGVIRKPFTAATLSPTDLGGARGRRN